MVIFSYGTIRAFGEKYTDSGDALDNWYKIMKKADFGNISELKEIFNTVDYVGNNLYVSDIKGNHYRIIARIIFKVRTIYIKFIGTHKEYDRVKLNTL